MAVGVFIPVSVGEIFDKISILELKIKNIQDSKKRSNIMFELEELQRVCKEHRFDTEHPLMDDLRAINSELWQIEDEIRVAEKNKNFDDAFIQLARRVYFTNDKRFNVKSSINALYGSKVVEEKSYEDYC